jgi:hypothetical protein
MPRPTPSRRRELEEFLRRPEAADPATRGRPPRAGPLHHEADESSRSQARGTEEQRHLGEQAYEDTIGPAQDTDRGPVLDEVYHRIRTPVPDRPPRRR